VAGRFNGKIELDVGDSTPDWETFTEPPFPFKGGKLKQVVVDRSGEPFGEMERHLEAASARD